MDRTDKGIESLLLKDADFINSKKHNFSLQEAVALNPEGLAPVLICRYLKIDILKFPIMLQEVLDKLQKSILSY